MPEPHVRLGVQDIGDPARIFSDCKPSDSSISALALAGLHSMNSSGFEAGSVHAIGETLLIMSFIASRRLFRSIKRAYAQLTFCLDCSG